MLKAVVDRIEEKWAVIFIDAENRSLNIDIAQLPSELREGDHVLIEMEDQQVVTVTIDEQSKVNAQQRIAAKLERLRRGNHLSGNNDDS